jgi:hypothetical protein
MQLPDHTIDTIHPKPGDVLVVRVPHDQSGTDGLQCLAEALRRRFLDNTVIVLLGDSTVDVIEEAQLAEIGLRRA